MRDPHVGRDVLVGVLGGVVVALAIILHGLVPRWFGWTEPPPIPSVPLPLLGPRFTMVEMLLLVRSALLNALEATIGVVVAKILVRRTWAVVLLICVVFFPVAINSMFSGSQPALDVPFTVITMLLMLTVLINYGLLALSVTFFVFLGLTNMPITADPSSAYATASWWLLGPLAALAAFGFYASRGSEQLLGRTILD